MKAILFCGGAGSGKNTAAQIVESLIPGTRSIALADPMKEFAHEIFGFSREALWGPSERRTERVTINPETTARFFHSAPRFLAQWFGASVGLNPHNGAGIQDSFKINAWWQKASEWFDFLPPDPTAREVLQKLGTELGRGLDHDLWIKIALAKIFDRGRFGPMCVTDGRFVNEVRAFSDATTYARGDRFYTVLLINPETVAHDPHPSENGLNTLVPADFTASITNYKPAGTDVLRMKIVDLLDTWGWIDATKAGKP